MNKAKRFIAFLLCATMLLGLLPTALAAETEVAYPVEGGNIYFDPAEGCIVRCDPDITAANIPSEIDGVTVERIGSDAFSYCYELSSVTIPGSVLCIEDLAFYSCQNLFLLTIEDGVEELCNDAFGMCLSLAKVKIPKSVTYISGTAFSECYDLTSIIIDEENECYCVDENSIIFSKDMLELVAFPACFDGNYEIPDGVESIGYQAFANRDRLRGITFSDSVLEIGDSAFRNCHFLSSVTIPENVVYIGEDAFYNCSSLQKVTVLNPDCEIYPSSDTLGDREIVTIYGAPNSTTQDYAQEFAFAFSATTCEVHTLRFIEAMPNNCATEGCIEHWVCNVCGRFFADEDCEQELSADSVYIPRLEHEYDEENICSNCGCSLPFVINMFDSANDGWNYNKIAVYEDSELIATLTMLEGSEATFTVDFYPDREYYFVWLQGAWPEECSFTITQGDELLFDSAERLLSGDMTFFAICEHEWIEGNCSNPTHCAKCHLFDGEAAGHDYETVVIDATCCTEGYTIYTCKICGETYTDDYQIPSDHDYTEVVSAPTCTEEGYTTYTCSYCGDVYTDNVIPPVHTLIDDVCTVCGAVSPFIIEMYDSWGDGWNACSLIVYKDSEEIATLTMSHGDEAIAMVDCDTESEYYFVWSDNVNESECSFVISRAGEILYSCDDASTLQDGQTVFAICEHSWLEATCEAPKTCEKCNMIEGESLPHDYNDEEMCTACGNYIPFVIDMYDIWGNGWMDCALLVYQNGELFANLMLESGSEATATVEYDPLCEYAFVWSGTLAADECGLTISRKGEVLYHSDCIGEYSDGVTLYAVCDHIWSEATCEDPQICEKCNLHLGLPAGHVYTYENIGETHILGCEVCDYSEEVPHNFIAGPCICGAIEDPLENFDENLKFSMNISAGAEMVVNYSFMASVVSEYDDFYLVVEKDVAGGDTLTTVYGTLDEHIALGNMPHPVTGEPMMYNAAYTGINAKEMGDSFATTLYAIDTTGKVYHGETVTASIKDFLIGKLEDDTSVPEMKTMAVDMLKYGAAAQVNFDYDAENLVTAELTEDQLALGTQAEAEAIDYATVSGEGANVNTNITVRSRVELSLSCIVGGLADPSGVICVITDAEGNVLTELATVNIGGVMYSATYNNVGAKQMRNVINAAFYDADGNKLSKTVTWSVESYVAQTRENAGATENEIALVNAMLVYGDSVAAYMAVK